MFPSNCGVRERAQPRARPFAVPHGTGGIIATKLKSDDLFRSCNHDNLNFETTEDLEPYSGIIGQPRASEAVQFGIDVPHEGYNIFALGPSGTGKRSMVWQFLEERASRGSTPDDWCYVNNFDEPHKPVCLRLPAGKGRQLRDDMQRLIDDVGGALVGAFEGDEYRRERQALEERYSKQQEETFEKIQKLARERGLEVMRTPQGLGFAPRNEDEGRAMRPDEIQELSEEEQEKLQEKVQEVQKEAQRLLQDAPRTQRQARDELQQLDRRMADGALEHLFSELRERYEDLPEVLDHLQRVKEDMVRNADQLVTLQRQAEQPAEAQQQQQQGQGIGGAAGQPLPRPMREAPLTRRYRVNLLVNHEDTDGGPLVYEDHPNYPNIIGKVDHLVQMGALIADFNMIKPGALHQANGGYLILEAHKLLMQPHVWEGLKRSLRARQVRIESLGEVAGLASTVTLEPEPIPLDVKVVLMGSPMVYHLLRSLDPDFAELFKVPADFALDMGRSDEDEALYARLVATLAQKSELKPFARDAVARVIERSSRLAGDSQKLGVHMRSIADLLHEADHWARRDGRDAVHAEHVQQAVEAQRRRSDRSKERIREEIGRGTIKVSVEGRRIGQINGLAVWPFGDFMFGRPTRISSQVSVGRGQVVDIEREVDLSEATHSKGVMILSGFLAGRFARKEPLSLNASLVFEQNYAGVGGDSASLAELYALLSSIGELPLAQGLAVTGSVNQHGEVQAIGGVNQKIEGFFDVCQDQGLTGEQGVLIPEANVQHLMLRQDIIDAVEAGRFHIHSIAHVDDGMELMFGVPAGERDSQGEFSADSVNGKVSAGLAEFARQRKQAMGSRSENNG
jgi:lon-related putative ATP-dependent protease